MKKAIIFVVIALALAMPAQAGVGSVLTYALFYKSNTGAHRVMYVTVPAHYSGAKIPLIISPHGRNVDPLQNVRMWDVLPSAGFILVSPEGQGRKYPRASWGWRGQISDLAKIPWIIRTRLPWLHYDPKRIYAIGGSMGGQEVLLLAARYPMLLAGVVAFDPATDLRWRYYDTPIMRYALTHEVGGTPHTNFKGYMQRSPINYTKQFVKYKIPTQIWYSTCDQIVVQQTNHQSGPFVKAIQADTPTVLVGNWKHSEEMQRFLPFALAYFNIIPRQGDPTPLLNSYKGC